MNDNSIYWVWVIAIFIMDINDLIRGHWFYKDLTAIIFFNLVGFSALWLLISGYRTNKKAKKFRR